MVRFYGRRSDGSSTLIPHIVQVKMAAGDAAFGAERSHGRSRLPARIWVRGTLSCVLPTHVPCVASQTGQPLLCRAPGLCCVAQGPPALCRSAVVSRMSRPAVGSPRNEYCGFVKHSPRPGSHWSHSPGRVCRVCHLLSIVHVAAGFHGGRPPKTKGQRGRTCRGRGAIAAGAAAPGCLHVAR